MAQNTKTVYYVGSIVFVVLSIVGFVYLFSTFSGFWGDNRMDNYPWIYVLLFSIAGVVGIANEIICPVDEMRKRVIALMLAAHLAAWIWGWIIIADDDTWDIISHEYRPMRRLILAYQILSIFCAAGGVAHAKDDD